jgi:translation initiation factor 3 subunit B
MGIPEPKLEDIKVEDVDFSDLEEQYAIPEDDSLDRFIVLDGAPIAPESKIPILTKVLTKFLSSAGKVENFHMPSEDGKSKGFAFVEYESNSVANKAIKQLNGKKLDVKHRLFLNKLSDIEKYGQTEGITEEFHEPEFPPLQETDYLKSWLQDPVGRDQFILQKGNVSGVFWNKRKDDPEPAIEPRVGWTDREIKFSPKGSYAFSIHPQGVQAWGGKDFKGLKRFPHASTELIDFSPNEKYLVTLSPNPIMLPPDDHPNRAAFPFGPESQGHKLVIWEIASGSPVRTFALPPNLENVKEMPWPLLKWSYDDKYTARLGPNALAIYDTSNDFQLVDKKPLKIEGLVDFEFAPSGVKLASSRQSDPPSYLLSYWTPESPNQTARVAILDVETRRVLRTINLFQVSDVRMHWQDNSEYLAVKVDRHTKSKKTLFSNLEFFKLNEKEIPVEKIELKDRVINFQWEPKGDRFVTISRPEVQGENNPAIPKNTISFFAPEISKKKQAAAGAVNTKKWIAFKRFDKKFSNHISFAPKGRFVAVSTISSSPSQGGIEFFDLDYSGEKKEDESDDVSSHVKLLNAPRYPGLTNVEWDPSGRFLAGFSTVWVHRTENGYRLYNLSGNLLREELVDDFKSFAWRPRPESLLTGGDRKKVRKNFREYSAQFDEFDAMEESTAARELILYRRRLLEEWKSFTGYISEHKEEYGIVEEHEDDSNVEIIEEIKEEVLEENEEIVTE